MRLASNRGIAAVYPVPVNHDDAVLFWYLQAPGQRLDRAGLHAALTAQMLKSGFFQHLRTEQQLGYVVSAFYWPLLDVPWVWRCWCSRPRYHSRADLATRRPWRLFLDGKGAEDGVTEEQFERHRTALHLAISAAARTRTCGQSGVLLAVRLPGGSGFRFAREQLAIAARGGCGFRGCGGPAPLGEVVAPGRSDVPLGRDGRIAGALGGSRSPGPPSNRWIKRL